MASRDPDQVVDRQIAARNVDQLAAFIHLPEIDAEKAELAYQLGHRGLCFRIGARKEKYTCPPAARGSSASNAAGR